MSLEEYNQYLKNRWDYIKKIIKYYPKQVLDFTNSEKNSKIKLNSNSEFLQINCEELKNEPDIKGRGDAWQYKMKVKPHQFELFKITAKDLEIVKKQDEFLPVSIEALIKNRQNKASIPYITINENSKTYLIHDFQKMPLFTRLKYLQSSASEPRFWEKTKFLVDIEQKLWDKQLYHNNSEEDRFTVRGVALFDFKNAIKFFRGHATMVMRLQEYQSFFEKINKTTYMRRRGNPRFRAIPILINYILTNILRVRTKFCRVIIPCKEYEEIDYYCFVKDYKKNETYLMVYAYKISSNVCLISPKYVYLEEKKDPRIAQYSNTRKKCSLIHHREDECVREYFPASKSGYRRINQLNQSDFMFHEVKRLEKLRDLNFQKWTEVRLKELNAQRLKEFQQKRQEKYEIYHNKIKRFVDRLEQNRDLFLYSKKYMNLDVHSESHDQLSENKKDDLDAGEKIESLFSFKSNSITKDTKKVKEAVENYRQKIAELKSKIMQFIEKHRPFEYLETFQPFTKLSKQDYLECADEYKKSITVENYFDLVNCKESFEDYVLLSNAQLNHLNLNPHNIDVEASSKSERNSNQKGEEKSAQKRNTGNLFLHERDFITSNSKILNVSYYQNVKRPREVNFIVKNDLGLFRCNRNLKIYRKTNGDKSYSMVKKINPLFRKITDEFGQIKLVKLTSEEEKEYKLKQKSTKSQRKKYTRQVNINIKHKQNKKQGASTEDYKLKVMGIMPKKMTFLNSALQIGLKSTNNQNPNFTNEELMKVR